jgi:hypothetical protein
MNQVNVRNYIEISDHLLRLANNVAGHRMMVFAWYERRMFLRPSMTRLHNCITHTVKCTERANQLPLMKVLYKGNLSLVITS